MSSWQNPPLSEVLVEVRPGFACGEDPSDGVFQFRMNNVTTEGQLDLSKKRRVPRETRNLEAYLVEPGDVLFNATNSPELVGKSAFFAGHEEPSVFSNHFLRLRPNTDKLDGRFLARWLTLQFQRKVFQGMCRQWVNQATVGRESLLALRIPLPPLTEQRQIAALLDKAEGLRTMRRACLVQLDALAEAIFLDLFGDPAINPKGWPKLPIGNIGTVITGNTPPREHSEYFGAAIEWIKSDNINTPHYYLTRASEGLSESGKAVARIAPPNSILVTSIAGSPDCIGNAAMTDREVAFNQQINALVPRQGDPHFLYAEILIGKRLIQEASTAAMKGMVSKSRFERILLPFPPLALQLHFSEHVVAIQKLRTKHDASLAELDALFAGLQLSAFQGDLKNHAR